MKPIIHIHSESNNPKVHNRLLLSIFSQNIDLVSKFFLWYIQQEIYNDVIIKDLTTS